MGSEWAQLEFHIWTIGGLASILSLNLRLLRPVSSWMCLRGCPVRTLVLYVCVHVCVLCMRDFNE